MARETCYFSSNYEEELKLLGHPAKMAEMTEIVQFPFIPPVSLKRLLRS
jgi:actin-related protein 5